METYRDVNEYSIGERVLSTHGNTCTIVSPPLWDNSDGYWKIVVKYEKDLGLGLHRMQNLRKIEPKKDATELLIEIDKVLTMIAEYLDG